MIKSAPAGTRLRVSWRAWPNYGLMFRRTVSWLRVSRSTMATLDGVQEYSHCMNGVGNIQYCSNEFEGKESGRMMTSLMASRSTMTVWRVSGSTVKLLKVSKSTVTCLRVSRKTVTRLRESRSPMARLRVSKGTVKVLRISKSTVTRLRVDRNTSSYVAENVQEYKDEVEDV